MKLEEFERALAEMNSASVFPWKHGDRFLDGNGNTVFAEQVCELAIFASLVLPKLMKVAKVASRFVPESGVIQLERREIDLRQAFWELEQP